MWDSSSYQMLQNIYNRLGELLTEVRANGTEITGISGDLESVLSNMQSQIDLLTYIACIGLGIFAFNVIMKWVKK